MTSVSFKEFSSGTPVQVLGNEGLIQKQESVSGPSFFQKLAQTAEQTGSNISDVANRVSTGKTDVASGVLQGAGAVAEGAMGAVGNAITSTPVVKDVVSAVAKPVSAGMKAFTNWVSDNPQLQHLATSPMADSVVAILDAHPDIAKNAEAVNNIANAILIAKGGITAGAKALETAPKILDTGAQALKTGVKQLTPSIEGHILPKALGIFTGESNDVIKSALANPAVADIGIKGGDTALRQAVQTGADASLKARTAFETAHGDAFKTLVADVGNPKLVGGKKVLYQFADDLKAQGIGNKGGKLDFSTSAINANPGEVAKITAAYKAIQGWKDFSLVGMNQLKQLVGKYTKFATEQGGSSKSPFLGKFYNYLDTEIKKSLPKDKAKIYGEMNQKFTNTIGMYNDVVDAFNSGDPFTKIAQTFGANKDTLRQVIDHYEKTTGNKIAPIVAGRTLAQEKNAAFGFLNPRQWVDFLIPPEKQAQAVTKIGKRLTPKSAKKISK